MKHIRIHIPWKACLIAALLGPVASEAFVFYSETTHTVVNTTQTAKRMARCEQFKLKEVQGSSADARTYWFSGVCKIWIVKFVGGKEQGTSGEASLWAEAKATWNAQSNRLEERVKLTDPGNKHSGTLELDFKCMQDPIVQNTSCVRLHFKNLTDWTGFEVPADKNQPMLAGRTTLAEVAGQTKSAAPMVGRHTSASVGVTTASPSFAMRQGSALPAVQAPRGVGRELAAVSCAAAAEGLRFSCATRAGFERCESLRRERKVVQCTLNETR